jgi:hypothetical protein
MGTEIHTEIPACQTNLIQLHDVSQLSSLIAISVNPVTRRRRTHVTPALLQWDGRTPSNSSTIRYGMAEIR